MDDTNTPTSYPAEELDSHLRQIRLATILPGRYVEPISCSLTTVFVDDLPEYYSLSYAWGDRRDSRQILLNGVPFNTRASEVFLWLGDYVETSIQETNLGTQSTNGQESFSRVEAVRIVTYIKQLSHGQHPIYAVQGAEQDRLVAELQALDKLMESSWWRRIWTVQEVILPPNVTIMIGLLQFSWTVLAAAARNFSKHYILRCCPGIVNDTTLLAKFYHPIDGIEIFRSKYHSREQINLLDLLHDFRSRLSTDPRDKIFGLLGLVMGDPKYHGLRVDYSLTADAVYENTFIYLLQIEGNLNALVKGVEVERMLDLPTWIPDWAAQIDQSRTRINMAVRTSLNLYKASLYTRSDICWPANTKILGVKGLLFDAVATLPEPIPDTLSITRGDIHNYIETLYKDMTNKDHSYIGGGDLAIAFRRLFTMDQVIVMANQSTPDQLRRATIHDYKNYKNTGILLPDDPSRILYIQWYRFFILKKGFIGLGPMNMRVGDTVHILLGGSVPFVLRPVAEQQGPTGQPKRYEFVGNCYVQGIMDGEALAGVDLDGLDYVHLV
ncbi:Nn.00g060860.m01.CDS01 [Neocucurbitaria sp. VM-36]